jgi:hypothetical protein
MIKQGDKVLCIKDFISKDEKSYIKGNLYEVVMIHNLHLRIVTIQNYVEKTPTGTSTQINFFSIGHSSMNNFYEYFITLAEWRNQQIDKILEDD